MEEKSVWSGTSSQIVNLGKSLRYEVTTKRIKITGGVFSKKSSALELYRVKDYTLEAPFFYRLFRLGHINIHTSDRSTPEIVLKAVPRLRKLMDDIRANVEARRDLKRVRGVDFDQAGGIVEN